MAISAGDGGCETLNLEGSSAIPTWNEIATQKEVVNVVFDMNENIRGKHGTGISKSMGRLVKRG